MKKLAIFHDYPVYGSITIEKPVEVAAWLDFLGAQILPADYSTCDLAPRHGFRFSTSKGDVDVLMCYQCRQLGLFGGSLKLPAGSYGPPFFSPLTGDLINLLFDHLSIKRDIPPVKD